MCDQTFVAVTFGPCDSCSKASPLMNIYIKNEPINYCSFCVEMVRDVFSFQLLVTKHRSADLTGSSLCWVLNTCIKQCILNPVRQMHTHTRGDRCLPVTPLLICGSLSNNSPDTSPTVESADCDCLQ